MRDISGSNNPNWKGGVRKRKDGYYLLYDPSHPNADDDGYILRHRKLYEQYLSILFDEQIHIPDDYVVHHIKPIKEGGNDALVNLELMTKTQHSHHHNKGRKHRLGQHKDWSHVCCYLCGSTKTRLHKPTPNSSAKTSFYEWMHLPWDKENLYCRNCYVRETRKISR